MLSRGARLVHRVTAVAYLGFGGLLFLAPAWAAERFPWTVSPFVAMTIGGWCIGVTCFSWIGGRRGPIGAVLPVLAFVWLFGLSEIAVVLLDKPIFRVEAPLAAPYVLSLALTLASGGFGLLELAHRAAGGVDIHGDAGAGLDRRIRWLLLALGAALGALAVATAFSGDVSTATSGKVFPEAITRFTVRAFAALNLSMAIGALVAGAQESRTAGAWLALAAAFLLVPTLAAAVANLGAFDFANRPLGWLYLGGYAVLLAGSLAFAWAHRDVFRRVTGVSAAVEAAASEPMATA
ncbi:MAG TPA: hypothetical protein VF484_09545 [Candidatus Limnocylindrales bacterium]